MEVPQEKLYAELPYESAIPFQGIYSEKTIIQKGTCTPGFPEALFTITKTGKPPKYLQTDGQRGSGTHTNGMCTQPQK